MNTIPYRIPRSGIGLTTALLAVLVASCSSYDSAPRQVQASNPTVTYKYHDDDELMQTNRLAADFCARYQAEPRARSFTQDSDRDNVVVFDCVATSGAGHSSFNPDLRYTYRTDQELLAGSQNAHAHCVNNGSSRVVSDVERNNDGTRTVTFQCR